MTIVILFLTLIVISFLLLNPFAYIFLLLFIPFLIYRMDNKILRDLILLIPLYIYYDTWSFVFFGLALAGHFFEGNFQRYFNLGIYSIVFSIVAMYFAFEGHPIAKVIFRYDWRYAPLEIKEIFYWSLPLYLVIVFIANGFIKEKNNEQEGSIEPKEKPKKIKKNTIDPNNASFRNSEKAGFEKWVRDDKTDK